MPESLPRPRSIPLLIACALLLGLTACPFGPTQKEVKQAEIEYDLGVNELKSGQIRQAMNFFSKAVELYPEFSQAHNAFGLTLHLLGKNDQALVEFEKALKLNPEFAEVRNNMARVYISQNRFREAIPLLRVALDNVFLRDRYLAESNLGWALFHVGQEAEGMKRVMNAISVNEKFCVGYEYLGTMYQQRKEYEEAIREFEQLLEQCPDYPSGHRALAKTLLMVGQVDKGCHHLAVCRGHGRMSPVGRDCDRLFRSTCPKEPAGAKP